MPSVRLIQHPSLPAVFIITLAQPQISEMEREKKKKKISDLCLRRYPFLSSFVKTKFQRIPAVLTRNTYEVKLSLTPHNFYGAGCGPGADNALSGSGLTCSRDREGRAEEPSADKPTLTADTLHICLPPVLRKRIHGRNQEWSRLGSYPKCKKKKNLLNTCQITPPTTTLFNSEPQLTSRPHPPCFSVGNRKKEEKVKKYADAKKKKKSWWNIFKRGFWWSVSLQVNSTLD